MGSRKKKSNTYKDRAVNLRELGLLPKGYRVNQLTDSQKRGVRKIESRMRRSEPTLDVLTNPGKYIFNSVDSTNAAELAKRGYTVVKTRRGFQFYAYADHAQGVRFDPRTNTVIRDYSNRDVTSYPFDSNLDTHARIRDFFRNRKRGQYLTMQVGDAPTFRIHIRDMKSFNDYITKIKQAWEEREGSGDDATRAHGAHPRMDNPIGQLQIVEIKNVLAQESNSRKPKTRQWKNRAKHR